MARLVAASLARPGLLDCAEVAAEWRLAGEFQAPRGQVVLLKAGAVGGGEHLKGEVAPFGGQGGLGSATMGIHWSEPRRSAVATSRSSRPVAACR